MTTKHLLLTSVEGFRTVIIPFTEQTFVEDMGTFRNVKVFSSDFMANLLFEIIEPIETIYAMLYPDAAKKDIHNVNDMD